MRRASFTVEPSLLGLLGIVFIVLKLTHCIDWSWWWVLTPFWLPVVAFAIGLGVFMIWGRFSK